jgi:signal transduction histidine kinase
LTSIIEKRRNLHLELKKQKAKTKKLGKELDGVAPLVGVGASMAMIAHEINNLLTPLGSYAALALKHSDDHELACKVLERTCENCKHASEVVQAILSVVNGRKQEKERVNLSRLVDKVFRCICRDLSKDNIRVEINIPDDLTVNVVPVKLQQVLMNLVLNAREAMLGSGGTLSIKAQTSKEQVTIEVRDSGCGIEKKYLTRMFEPFFTTKNGQGDNNMVQSGSGLGLYLCQRVIDEHGGTISVESEPDMGSTFIITLPER